MWNNQKSKCTLCGDEVNKTTGWKMHLNDKNKKEIVHPECQQKDSSRAVKQRRLIRGSVDTVNCLSAMRLKSHFAFLGANLGDEGACPM